MSIASLIRSKTPVTLRRFVRRTGEYFGKDLDQHEKFPSIEGALRALHGLGFNPRHCIDVGAYHGEWTKTFKTEFPHAKVLMVEAQESKRAILEQVKARYSQDVTIAIALLGAADGTRVTFSEMETGSSVYAETSLYPRNTVQKNVCRLDSLRTQLAFPKVDFLKLDVQGYELEILKGAGDVLAQTMAVLLEASLIPINAKCPLIDEVMIFMDRAGFRLFDFCGQIRRKDGVLWQTDLLFLRKDSTMQPSASLNHENWH